MYKQYISKKDSQNKSLIEKNKAPYDKIKNMIESLVSWLN